MTATNASYTGGGSAQATSAYTTVVPSLVSTGTPTISGTDTDTSALTATNGTWAGISPTFSYQWEDCNSSGQGCVPISEATSQTYVLADPDVGQTVRVTVTAANPGGSLASTSTQTSIIQAIPASNASVPTISGTAQAGTTLTVLRGSWAGAPTPTYSYQWQLCDEAGQACTSI